MSPADTAALRPDRPQATPPSPMAAAWEKVIAWLHRWLAATAEQGAASGTPASLLAPLRDEPRFAWLQETFVLEDREAAVVAVCHAADLDPGLGRHFARLRGASRPGGPDLSTLQTLLCGDLDERTVLRSRFTWDARLFRHRLLQLGEADPHAADPFRTATIQIDPQIARTLAYGDWLDPRLARYCRLHSRPPAQAPAAIDLAPVATLANAAYARREPLLLAFMGRSGSGRRATARHLAARAGAKLLVADLGQLCRLADFADLAAPLLREAWLQDAWLYLEGLEALWEGPAIERQRFLDDLAEDGGICILACRHGLPFAGRRPLAPLTIDFDAAPTLQSWREALQGGIALSGPELEMLSSRYRLPPSRIRTAAMHATQLAQLRGGLGAKPVLADLVRAARLQGPGGLSKLARKIEPIHRWEHLVLPADAVRQMREICARVEQATRVFHHWGFGPRMSLGKGTAALFAGASGTGKTMAAEVIASELGLDLYKIDLATVVSKYIGETEKNLDRVFAAARNANAILLFDEADALFGKRSEVRDAHDRYANLEVAYLLQKMEEYEGLSILSSNLKQNLDDAFLRRLTYTVLFPLPTAADRERIWRSSCPADLPLAADVDFGLLANGFKMSGGNIRNALLAAAFFAAQDGGAVSMPHLIHGVRRELQKAGKIIGELDPETLSPLPPAAGGRSAKAGREAALVQSGGDWP